MINLQSNKFSKSISYCDERGRSREPTPAFGHSIWYSCTRRIDHGHEANKTQVLSGEVHIFSIKCKTLRKLVIREAKSIDPRFSQGLL
uniref:Uncharacterized protein n=1 Tax=Sinocyclocheilus rhinocerous TaxID=307959 RepID=A0A673MUQ3_9TELE